MRPDAVSVELTESEAYFAASIGLYRQIRGTYTPRAKHRWNCDPRYGWKNNALGAVAEFAVAKALGVYWTGMFTKNVDVGADLEVRYTESNGNSLIVHDSDPDDRIFILVTGLLPELWLQGWMRGEKAKSKSYWRKMQRADGSDSSAYFVPQENLNGMVYLMENP